MSTELIDRDVVAVLFRMTLVLIFSWAAISVYRRHRPSLAIVIARCLLIAMWAGPLLILSGWSLPFAVLPGSALVARTPMDHGPLNVAIENTRVVPTQLAIEGSVVGQATPTTPKAVASVSVTKEPNAAWGSVATYEDSMASKVASGDHDQSTAQTFLTKPAKNAARNEAWVLPSVTFSLEIAWTLITVFLLSRFAVRIGRTAGAIRRSEPCNDTIASTLNRIADRLQITVCPRVRISHEVTGPCTVGWYKPIVLLPSRWLQSNVELTETQLEMILAHELTHVRWQDAAWDAIGQMTRAIWWFHPLVSVVTSEHRLACEHRCDAAASRIAGDVDTYRRQLARWALAIRDRSRCGTLSDARHAAPISLSMAERPLMLRRLRWLKAGELSERISVRGRVFAVIGMALLGVLCTTVQPTQRLSAAAQSLDEFQGDKDSGETTIADVPAEKHILQADREKMLGFADDSPEVDWDNPVSMTCVVMNEGGEPISGAEVQMSMLTDLEGNSATFVLEGGALSDGRGALKIMLPGGVRRFDLRVVADGYANFSNESFKIMDKIEVRMKSGRVLRVQATNADGELLPEAFPMVEDSNIWGREFEQQNDGTHLSPVLTPQRRWMWVVDGTAKDEAMLFSELIDLNDDKLVDESGLIRVALRPGARLEGVLSNNVPRPIKNGFVHVAVRDGKQHHIDGFNRSGLVWHEYAAIDPDGTFVFPSLPRDAHAQLFVLCEGWQSVSPSRDQVEAYFLKHDAGSEKLISDTMNRYNSAPQLAHLDSRNGPVQVTILCRETASLDVRVVDPSGNPVAGANATMSPNLAFFGDLVIPGVEMWSHDLVRNNGNVFGFGDASKFQAFATASFLSVTTDATGVARFRNLPNLSDSFEVESPGYVMAAYPTSNPDQPGRYGLAKNLRAGEVVKMTVTLEKDVVRTARDVTCVYVDGSPIADLNVTLTAISTAEEHADWQQWSVQRFGEVSKGVTDTNGMIRLAFPQSVDGKQVLQLFLHMQGIPRSQISAWSDLAIPAAGDNRVIRFSPEEKPRSEGSYRFAIPEYVDILASSNATQFELLKALLERNDLLVLKQLLAVNGYDAVTPIELQPNLNRTELRNKSPIERVPTRSGDRVIALATVRPKGAKWGTKSPSGSIPEAAFIFDTNGKLIRVLGGGTSLSDGEHNTMLTNLGGTFDFFVRVSGFESHAPYEYASRWYVVGEMEQPALTVHHQANAGSWTSFQGTKFPLAEYAFLGYGLNGVDIDRHATGRSSSGVQVPRSIVWDRPSGKFYGELTQSYDGQPTYKVIVDESPRFAEVFAQPGQAVVIGGRRDMQNWHLWELVVQEGQSLKARLELRDADGKTVRLIRADELTPGQHTLQLLFEDAIPKEGGADEAVKESLLVVMFDAQDLNDRTQYQIPHITVDETPTVPGQNSYLAAEPPLRIITKQCSDMTQSLVWIIE